MSQTPLLLTIDVGNTQATLGLFALDNGRPAASPIKKWGIPTKKIVGRDRLSFGGLSCARVRGVMIASVVPSVDPVLKKICARAFPAARTIFVDPRRTPGVKVLYDNPGEVGADRVVNAVAAFERCGRSAIVVDFGTATTFDCVGPRGEYLGGVIAPGPRMSADALAQKTAKLPQIKIFQKPRRVIGKNTVDSMSSGLFFGYVDLAAGIVRRLKTEMGGSPAIFITGGFARLMGHALPFRAEIVPDLTLEGLAILWGRNQRRIQ